MHPLASSFLKVPDPINRFYSAAGRLLVFPGGRRRDQHLWRRRRIRAVARRPPPPRACAPRALFRPWNRSLFC